jgi:hypothetical protein
MAVSNGFWPLNLSVESLVLREIVPIYLRSEEDTWPTPTPQEKARLVGMRIGAVRQGVAIPM